MTFLQLRSFNDFPTCVQQHVMEFVLRYEQHDWLCTQAFALHLRCVCTSWSKACLDQSCWSHLAVRGPRSRDEHRVEEFAKILSTNGFAGVVIELFIGPEVSVSAVVRIVSLCKNIQDLRILSKVTDSELAQILHGLDRLVMLHFTIDKMASLNLSVVELRRLSHLTELRVVVSDSDLDVLGTIGECCQGLKALQINPCCRESAIRFFESHASLENVVFDGIDTNANLDDVVVALATHGTNLQSLDVGGTYGSFDITDIAMIYLSKCCPRLQELCLNGCRNIAGPVFVSLARNCPSLRRLHVPGCVGVSDDLLKVLASSCSQLIDLDISEIPSLSDLGLRALAAGCFCLQSLIVDDSSFTDEGFVILATSYACTELEELSASGTLLSDIGLHAIASSCHRLGSIELEGAMNFSDNGLSHIFSDCPSLKSVAFWTPEDGFVTSAVVSSLFKHCVNLSYLQIRVDEILSYEALSLLVDCSGRLESLVLGNCPNLTDKLVVQLLENAKYLGELELSDCSMITGAVYPAIALAHRLRIVTFANCKHILEEPPEIMVGQAVTRVI